jgi:hypothetical protein
MATFGLNTSSNHSYVALPNSADSSAWCVSKLVSDCKNYSVNDEGEECGRTYIRA